MTTHYINITLLPDPEFSHAHLLGALVAKLHRALVQGQTTDTVSYPQHVSQPLTKRTLGAVLRLHGTPEALQRLMEQDWLKGMRDHTQAGGEPLPVPAHAQHRTVSRRQFKTNADRLRRRRMQRRGKTAEQAAAAIPDAVERRPDLAVCATAAAAQANRFACAWSTAHCNRSLRPEPSTPTAWGTSATVPWF